MHYAARTHIGKRKSNQDFTAGFWNKEGMLAAILCDGLGGHRGGDVASEMTVNYLGECWERTSFSSVEKQELVRWIEQTVTQANQKMIEVAAESSELVGMGTTLVAAFFMTDSVLVVNIGDSRAYVYRTFMIQQITNDHSLAGELERMGKLEESEVSINQHVLTRSLGSDEEIVLDYFHLDYKNFTYLLLCSDGLSNVVTEQEMIDLLMRCDLSDEEKAESLIERALAAGGTDNITVSLIRPEQNGEEVRHESE